MTNFLHSFAPEAFSLALLALVCGCGSSDGKKEYAEGKAAFEIRNFEKAAKQFEKSLACAPDNLDALVMLARVKLEVGEIEAAQKLVDKAAGCSDSSDVKTLQAQIAWHVKDFPLATRLFQELANDEKLTPAERADAWSGLGVVEMSGENSHLARIAFLRALRLNFKSAPARYHLGLLYRDGFNYHEAALEQFQVFVRLEADASPRVQKVKISMIPALQKLIASEAADRPGASKRDSSSAAAAISRAVAAERKGQTATARAEYETALKADPLSYPAAYGLAKCWRKTTPSKKKKGDSPEPLARAMDYYQLACALQPGKVSVFLEAGDLAMRLGRSAQAAEIFSRAVASSPTSFAALDGLIRALRRQGKTQVAKAYQDYRESIPVSKK